jgi:peptide/nickel transport system permease protein
MRFFTRRFLFYLLTAWAALTLNFLIPRLMPGNPVEIMIAKYKGQLSPAAVKSLTALFGLNHAGLGSQYVTYWKDLLQGNLGTSVTYFPSSVASVIAAALPWTAVLVGISTVISFFLGTLLGVIVAWRRGSWLDGVLPPATTFLLAIPYFWFGLIAIYLFGVLVHVFPTTGGFSNSTTIGFTGAFLSSAAYHAILPAITIVASSIAGWLIGMRNMMVSTLFEDYVMVAEAKGLPKRRVMLTYAARNAVLPSIASFALSLGFVVSGALLVEVVFSYPGIGYVLLQAVSNEDYPLMQGVFLIITLAVLVANIVADGVYVLLDPRTRQDV